MKRVKDFRKLRGLSQVELAERAGVAQGSLSRIERGSGNPTFDVIQALADALKVPVGELFERDPLIDRASAALLRVSPEVRATAVELLEALAPDSTNVRN